MANLTDLARRTRSWIADDPDPETRQRLTSLVAAAVTDAEARHELEDSFTGRLEFGTAGLRGRLGPGPNRMNRAVVIKAAAGLAGYLRDASRERGSVVIGYDARHKSGEFARDTAAVLDAAGFDALLLPSPLPTPVLAFAVRHLGAAAGVMVTASHNPRDDNGYKVYLGDGSQLVSPADAEISARIEAIDKVAGVPRSDGWTMLGDDVRDAYLDAIASGLAPGPRGLSIAYTPLHGVGAETVRAALARAGFADPVVVPEQAAPDPDFPTTQFPNPEEPGVMDAVIALADDAGADLAVANDPDADRCAVAVPTPVGWRRLSGDEVGVLLADAMLRHGITGVYATTIVSSMLLSKLASTYGVEYAETLTGFKWIGRVPGLVYGYEEALGYCVAPSIVGDKDGVSALLAIAVLAAELALSDLTLLDRLDELARRYGLHATDQLSIRMDDPALIDSAVAALAADPPARLGGFDVVSLDDLSAGGASAGRGALPPTNGLRLGLAEGGRVVVRPSGTEPKLKCYLEVLVPVREEPVEAARISAAGRLDAIRSDLAAALRRPGSARGDGRAGA